MHLPPADSTRASPSLRDRLGRPLRDLRLSVTDRCNFRCRYCMPREAFESGGHFLPKSGILRFEEIARLARLFVQAGVSKIRLTGGEPLLRAELPRLVGLLSPLDTDLALTTNAVLLHRHARDLREAGLHRITVSLDALDDDVFQAMSDAPAFRVRDVLRGIDEALRAGFPAPKINCVVRRGVNEGQVKRLIAHFRGTGSEVRFIEFMDVGETNGWRANEVVAASEILEAAQQVAAFAPVERTHASDVARRYRSPDGTTIGIISSVSAPFCGDCSRARLSADGHLYTCLFARSGVDLLTPLRAGESDAELERRLVTRWQERGDRYSEQRADLESRGARNADDRRRHLPTIAPRVEMSFIGG